MTRLLSIKDAVRALRDADILPSVKLFMKHLIRDGYIRVYESKKSVLYKPDKHRVDKLRRADAAYHKKQNGALDADFRRLYQ